MCLCYVYLCLLNQFPFVLVFYGIFVLFHAQLPKLTKKVKLSKNELFHLDWVACVDCSRDGNFGD